VAALLMPPWPLQAPRPPCADVVPSLQTTGPPLPAEEPLAAAGAAASSVGGAVVGAAAGAVPPLEAALLTPPWPLQAPRPECVEVVPSLQTTAPAPADGEELAAVGAGAGAAAAGALAELAEADLLIPPCPLQAPRPPCGEVVPSLHTTGLLDASWADDTAGAASNAAASMAPRAKVFNFVVAKFMTVLPSGQRGIGLARILYYIPAQVRRADGVGSLR